MARSHQPWQVGVQRVVGKASEFHFARTSVSPFRQHDVEDISRFNGIVSKGFVEIAHPKKEQRFRVIGFDPIVLLHKGCRFLGHGSLGHAQPGLLVIGEVFFGECAGDRQLFLLGSR